MPRMIDLIRNKGRKKPPKEDQKDEEEKQKVEEKDTRIFPRPEEPEGKTEAIASPKAKEPEKLAPDKSVSAIPERDADVLPEKEITEISTLDEVIRLYDIGIKILHKISTVKTIAHISWQEIQNLIGKTVEIAARDSKVTIDVATNHFSGSSYLHETIMNTCLLSIRTGIGLKYSKDKLIELGTAAFLHNIGKFDIEELVNEEDELTAEQWTILRQYPNYSVRKLEKLPEVTDVIKKGISQGREKIDGSGYPEGLKGDDIHEYAQIIDVVVDYEAMTHPRQYKEKKLPYDAMDEIIQLAGKKYNSRIAKMFVNEVSVYPVGSLVKLNNLEVAKVVDAIKNFPLRPVVAVILDKNGHQLKTPRVINLQKNPVLSIKESVNPDEVGIDAKEILKIRYKKQ